MKKIIVIVLILIASACLLLFIKRKILLLKFGPINTNLLSCRLQNRHWSTKESICVTEYQDGGKSCFTGKDCLSGKCLLDEAIFRQWLESVYKKDGGLDPNRSVSRGDKIVYPQLPDNIKGKCSMTNLCDYRDADILIDNGIRHAYGSHCFQE